MVKERLGSAGRRAENQGSVDLNFEWQRQTKRLIYLGFHRELGLSEEKYLSSLPKFESQPGAFRGRFNIPVLVERRIAPQCQAKLAGLDYYLENLAVFDWKDDSKGYKTPDTPHATWMQDGKKNLKEDVSTVRENFASDERGATVYDGIALFIAHPEILKDHGIDLPGTSVESDRAPFLYQWYGGPKLSCDPIGYSHPGVGSASCGRV